jgi:phenylacetic acid degradation operon negative regulatory protein
MRTRKPAQLLLALFGELVVDRVDEPVPATLIIDVLDGADIAAPTTRATLNRMASRDILEPVRRGREIGYLLTESGVDVLREAAVRVNRERPFDPQGSGWTLVTFSLPEKERTLRHRLRASLTWAGFAPLRDGLWVAPGAVDLAAALGPIHDELPPHTVTAFVARELPGFEMGASVESAWEIGRIREEHDAFLAEWLAPAVPDCATPALTARTALIADWLALLRADPGLPAQHLGTGWPADKSLATFKERRDEVREESEREFAARLR